MYIFRRSSRCPFTSCVVIARNIVKSLNSTILDNTISIVPSANGSNFLLIKRCVMISSIILDFSSVLENPPELEAAIAYVVISIRYCHYKFTILYFTIQKLILSSNSYLNFSTIALIILNCYTISMDSNIITCRSQVRNPAGLRRFLSLHPSLFFQDFWWKFLSFFPGFLVEFLGSNEEGMWVGGLYRGGDPVARGPLGG